MKRLVPDDFEVPAILETGKFRLRMLSADDAEKDYDAVITSVEHLKGFFGPDNPWPLKDLTLEQDRIDLSWHQKEFQRRTSFAYTVMNLDESKCLGCVYVFPSENESIDAFVFLWVRKSELNTGLDEELFDTVKKWINEKWPFKKVIYPGREPTWDELLKQ